MYVKIFEYGFDWKLILSFIEWWIKSGNFSKDIKKGDRIYYGKSIRDIDHTILVTQKGKFELIIEKGAIISDNSPRELKEGELYLNKWSFFGGSGFEKSVRKIKKWLEEIEDYNPYLINSQKADMEALEFDMIGVGFFIETCDGNKWKLRIVADVVGLPK